MKTIAVSITGLRPLVLHNGQLADPTNQYVREIAKITSKKKKMTEADHERRNELEWHGGIYWSDELEAVALPSDNIEGMLRDGAKKNRLGKDFAAAVFVVEPEVEIRHRLSGKPKATLLADAGYTLRKGVKVGPARIMRIRPMIPSGWTASFSIEYDETIVNRQQVVTAITEAGSLVGLGDWRPKFGRFELTEAK